MGDRIAEVNKGNTVFDRERRVVGYGLMALGAVFVLVAFGEWATGQVEPLLRSVHSSVPIINHLATNLANMPDVIRAGGGSSLLFLSTRLTK